MTSNKPTWANLKVGIVVLLALGIFIFLISVVGTEQNIFASTYSLKVFMKNVKGLVEGARVSLGGLKVGFVSKLQFTSKDGVNGVDVTFDVLEKYRPSITTSTIASVRTIGLLGDKYIDLSIGNPNETPLEEGVYVPLVESFDFETAGPQFKSALEDFTHLLESVRHIASSIERGEGSVGKFLKEPVMADELERFLQSLNRAMDAIEQGRGTLGSMVYDETVADDIRETTANLRVVTGQIRSGKGTVGKLVMDESLYTSLSSVSTRLDSIMGKAANDSSNVSRLISDPRFYEQLIGALQEFHALVRDLKEHPERYLQVSVF